MNSVALELSNLTVHIGNRCLLEVDQLRAEVGTIVALMGPNGAGKTTLLRACLGLAEVSHGTITVLGKPLVGLRGATLAAVRRRIGYVPQILPVRSELPLTVREVVAIGRTANAGLLHPLSHGDWQIVDEWLERLGLAPLGDRAFNQLSGGEQRKTIIARAMAQRPELLLLDEPTANLDLRWRERIVETVETLFRQTRISVVLVCHELEVLPPACRKIVLLEAGRITATGTPEQVFTTGRVNHLYGANFHALHRAGRHTLIPKEKPQ